MERTGAFWDGVTGRAPMPPAARTLGFELVEADPEEGSIIVAFAGIEAFTNPFGEVLGGFVSAMLYDTVGPALLATLPAGQFIETLELHAQFLGPAKTGRLIGRGVGWWRGVGRGPNWKQHLRTPWVRLSPLRLQPRGSSNAPE